MRSPSSTSWWSSAMKIPVTVYLSTSYLSECQLLCNARASRCLEALKPRFHQPRLLRVLDCSSLLVPFLGFDCRDLGTRFDSTIAHISTWRTKRKSQPVRDDCDDDADPGHLKTRSPPRADCDERFQSADGKMRDETDSERSDNGVEAAGEKERNDRNKRADCRGNAG